MLDKNESKNVKNTTFNINTNMSGGALQQNISQEGGEANQTVTQVGDVTVEAVLSAVEAALPKAEAAEIMPQLRAFAAMPPDVAEEPENKGRIATVLATITKWQPIVAKNLAVFGVGALESLATLNPIVNGIWHVCKAQANAVEPHSPGPQFDAWGSGVVKRG